jgi:hypothetical protein
MNSAIRRYRQQSSQPSNTIHALFAAQAFCQRTGIKSERK